MSAVLIIDDSPEEREFLHDVLADAAPDVDVTACHGSADGIPAAAERAFDCVLLDLRLDGEDGLDVLEVLQRSHPALPVIVLSGQGSEQAATAAFVAGAAYYLSKDAVTPKTLWTAVERVIQQAARARELKVKNEAIERSNRLDAVGQLAAGIAHDFNNQLGAMRMCLELIKDASDTDRFREQMRTAFTIIEQSSGLATRLLSLSRQGDLLAKDVPVQEVLKDVSALARAIVPKHVTLEVSEAPADLVAFCDQGQLLHAILNLVLNARDATGGKDIKGHVHVAAQRHADTVRICVTDNGSGMSKEDLAKCTDTFFTTKSERNGTGLGLAMVQSFVSDNGGELLLTSTMGEGTEATLVLPLGAVPPALPLSQPSAVLQPAAKQHVLLVEDEYLIAIMTKAVLEERDFRVTMVTDAKAALAVFDGGDPVDVMITDIKMSGMDGFGLANRVHAQAPDTAIIYLTGYGETSMQETQSLQGPVLQKPVEPDDLVAAIKSVIAQA